MSQLTRSEQMFIQRSCNPSGSAERRRKLMPWAFAMVCGGAIMIILGDAQQPRSAEFQNPEFRKTIGFLIVLVGFMGHVWLTDRKERVAQSLIAKLCRRQHCPHCGQEVIAADGSGEE